MNALLGNELIEILSLEKLVNESRSLCHIVSVLINSQDRAKAGGFYSDSLSGAVFSLNGPASLARQEDSEGPSMVAACRLHGLPRAVCSSSSGQKKAHGSKRAGKEVENWENEQEKQNRKVVQHSLFASFVN